MIIHKSTSKWGIDPERDIWSLGVMVQGSGQMGELLGRRRRRSETVLVFGPESVSYERSRHENWTILREISARIFLVKIPKTKKNHISNVSRIWETLKNRMFNISRIGLSQKKPISNISRIMENVADSNFQYFQAGNN